MSDTDIVPKLPDSGESPNLATALIITGLLGAALYLGRELFVPLAMAVLLSFVLSPLVVLLRDVRIPRAPAVLIVVTLAVALIALLGFVMGRQLAELAGDLPRYESTLRAKIHLLRPAGSAPPGVIERATEAIEGLSRELEPQQSAPAGPQSAGSPGAARPVPVEIRQAPRALEYYQTLVTPLLAPLASAGLVVIFVIFILLQREDLRDRFIRLFGGEDFQRTTAAMTDAASRLSRYFLTLTAMNAVYGAAMAVALLLLGLPAPVLWGILAALMRFVPYIGSFIAAAFPVLLAAAVEPGWSLVAATLAIYVVGELVMGQVMEPWLLGSTTGLTPLAVIGSAAFWTWLWGPVGLLLAVPLTVCLIVLGRHVPQLGFLYVLLGDQPALTPPQRFYQRMLAGDLDEITYDAEQFLKKSSLVDYFDDVVIPGLGLAQQDARRGRFSAERLAEMKGLVDELIYDLADVEVEAPRSRRGAASTEPEPEPRLPILMAGDLSGEWQGEAPLLCIGVRNPLDHAAASVLAHLAAQHGLGARVVGADAVTPAHIADLDLSTAQLAILSSIDAARPPAYAELMIRRLRRRKPGLPVLVGSWSEQPSAALNEGGVKEQNASGRVTTLRGALSFALDAARKPDLSEASAARAEMTAAAT